MGEYLKHKFAFIIELTDADKERMTEAKASLIDKSDEAAIAYGIMWALYSSYDTQSYYINARITMGELVEANKPSALSERLHRFAQVGWVVAAVITLSRHFISGDSALLVSALGVAVGIADLILWVAAGIAWFIERRRR